MTNFDFNQDYMLEDARVLLRPLAPGDLNHLVHFSIDEPEIWQYSLIPAVGKENLANYLQAALDHRAAQKEYPFIVFDKKQGKYAGSTRFYDIQLDNKTMQLGYTWYGKDFQGTGLNKHCKYLLFQFAFETIGLERIELRADNRNERSKAAMRSIGCVEEGVLRAHLTTLDGGRRDSIVLSILKDEWFGGVKHNLGRRIYEV